MKHLAKALERLGDELTAKLDRFDAFGKHAGEKGERRENAFAEIMEDFLPDRFRIGTGEVVSASGQTSKQIDILVYDNLNSPVLIDARDTQIVPAESVYAAIELKPNLASVRDLQAAFDNIRSVKSLPRTAILPSHGGHRIYHGPKTNPPVYGAILTYGEHWEPKRIGDEMASYCRSWPRELWMDQVCIAGSCVLLYAVEGPDGVRICRPWEAADQIPKLCLRKVGKIAFGFFLLEMLYHIGQMELFPPDLQQYLNAAASDD